MITVLLLLPLVAAALLLAVPKEAVRRIRLFSLAASGAVFVVSLFLLAGFDGAGARWQYVESAAWIPSLGIRYEVGIDGIALLLIVLTTFLTPVTILGSKHSILSRERDFYILMLALESFMIGAFAARDLFLFYVFWELMLLPMLFIIGVWGGPRRLYATIKFVLFTLAGSLPMLAAILYLGLRWRVLHPGAEAAFLTADLLRMPLTLREEWFLFIAFALSFAVKVPLFPLHTWLPDAHVEAPTPGSVILAGVLLKMGGYGLIRYAIPLFPHAAEAAAPWMFALAGIAVVYGALVAMAQHDVKKLVAFSSVSHMGLVVIGAFTLNAEGLTGSVFQMISHGLTTGGLFLLVGMLYERLHTRNFAEMGGLAGPAPRLASAFFFVTLGSIGLPGLTGFVGEFLILAGTVKVNGLAAVAGASGLVFGAWYMLRAWRRIFYGPLTRVHGGCFPDLDRREKVTIGAVAAMILLLGLFPTPFLRKMDGSVRATLEESGARLTLLGARDR